MAAVDVEANLEVVSATDPIQTLTKLPLELARECRSVGGIPQQKASNRKQ